MPERIKRDADFHATALRRYDTAKTAWSDIREDFEHDLRFAWPRKGHGQWDPAVEAAREQDELPALTFNELHPHVQQVVNRARQERPQPKVTAGDKGTPETAEVIEGKLRHIHYASQADVAYDTAVVYQAGGGIGYYDVTLEYIDDGDTFIQEPRIKRVQDPLTEYPDPTAIEADFSDAKWWISRYWMDRDQFEAEFNQEPIEFGDGKNEDWSKEEQVCIAKYWTVEITKRRKVQLSDGTSGFDDELDKFDEKDVVNERPVDERHVFCDIIDGEKVLETTEWVGHWIPKVPVLGAERVVNGKRQFISVIRYSKDAQKLENAYESSVAEKVGSSMDGHYLGQKGQFKDQKWRESRRQKYYEYEPVTVAGQPAPPPQWVATQAQIQEASAAAMAMRDFIRISVGYADNVLQPSAARDLSGVAVKRRDAQQQLTNYHIMDNLEQSQFHCARICVDLLQELENEPRPMKIMGKDKKISTVAVTTQREDGSTPTVPGFEGKPHHRLDVGGYDIAVETGPTWATEKEEEAEELQALMEMLAPNPPAMLAFLPGFLERRGYLDLVPIAEALQPPQIAQAMQAKQQGIPPMAAAKISQLTAQNQQLMQVLQKVQQILQSKQIEQQGRLAVEHVKTTGAVMVEGMKQQHDAAKHMATLHTDAIEHVLNLLHESELTPTPQEQMQMQAQQAAMKQQAGASQ